MLRYRKPLTIILSNETIEQLRRKIKNDTGIPISRILEKAFEKVYANANKC